MSAFFRFSSTTHIAWLANGTPSEDKVQSAAEADALLKAVVAGEEKIDSGNLGALVPAGPVGAG